MTGSKWLQGPQQCQAPFLAMSQAHQLPLHRGAPWVSPLAMPSAPARGMQVGVMELLADGEGLGQRRVWWECAAAHLEAAVHRDLFCCRCHNLPQQDLAQAGHGQAWWLGSPCRHGLTAPSLDVSPMDAVSAGTQKDELTLRIVVRMPPQHIIKGVSVDCMGSLTCPSAMALDEGQRTPVQGWIRCSNQQISALAPRTSSSRNFSWAGPR